MSRHNIQEALSGFQLINIHNEFENIKNELLIRIEELSTKCDRIADSKYDCSRNPISNLTIKDFNLLIRIYKWERDLIDIFYKKFYKGELNNDLLKFVKGLLNADQYCNQAKKAFLSEFEISHQIGTIGKIIRDQQNVIKYHCYLIEELKKRRYKKFLNEEFMIRTLSLHASLEEKRKKSKIKIMDISTKSITAITLLDDAIENIINNPHLKNYYSSSYGKIFEEIKNKKTSINALHASYERAKKNQNKYNTDDASRRAYEATLQALDRELIDLNDFWTNTVLNNTINELKQIRGKVVSNESDKEKKEAILKKIDRSIGNIDRVLNVGKKIFESIEKHKEWITILGGALSLS